VTHPPGAPPAPPTPPQPPTGPGRDWPPASQLGATAAPRAPGPLDLGLAAAELATQIDGAKQRRGGYRLGDPLRRQAASSWPSLEQLHHRATR
jgi:hypothetical protein